jgi:hypothetical protein
MILESNWEYGKRSIALKVLMEQPLLSMIDILKICLIIIPPATL